MVYYVLSAIFCFAAAPRLKRHAVPSQFAWTKSLTESVIKRAERAKRRSHLNDVIFSHASRHTNSEKYLQPEVYSDIEISVNEVTVYSSTKDVSTQCGNTDKVMCDVSTNTMNESKPTNGFNILLFQSVEKQAELKYYTGFDSYDHFWVVFTMLGPAVNHLIYFHPDPAKRKHVYICSPVNEFFLTVMKLRRNMPNKELAFRFDISESSVSQIFVTWINFLYCQFKELKIWVPLHVAKENMKIKGQKCSSTVIIDCTEIKIEQSKNPVSQQLTYSTYKSCNTVKVLVGMSSIGTVTFVSDAYGGAISDRALFEKSGLSNLLTKNDIVLADKGFQIQDLLAPKDVKVNMPEFLKKKAGQLEPDQLDSSKKTSADRIHIERVIGLAKTYKILKGTLTTNLVPLASRIIFVCFMLVNLRQNIMEGK